jgi:hypothetical protein
MTFEGTPVGVNVTPFAVRTPLYSPPGRVRVFEKVEESGLNCPIFETCGQKRTFPLGMRTPPLKFPRVTPGPEMLVNVKVLGL